MDERLKMDGVTSCYVWMAELAVLEAGAAGAVVAVDQLGEVEVGLLCEPLQDQ